MLLRSSQVKCTPAKLLVASLQQLFHQPVPHHVRLAHVASCASAELLDSVQQHRHQAPGSDGTVAALEYTNMGCAVSQLQTALQLNLNIISQTASGSAEGGHTAATQLARAARQGLLPLSVMSCPYNKWSLSQALGTSRSQVRCSGPFGFAASRNVLQCCVI